MHRKSRLLMLVTKYRSGGLVSYAKSNVLLSGTTKNENKYQHIQKFKTLNLKQYFSRLFEQQQADISYQLDDICSRGFTIYFVVHVGGEYILRTRLVPTLKSKFGLM